ncbi:MAG: hypothetical protein ABIO94_01060 [Opitutaceae bacterium]
MSTLPPLMCDQRKIDADHLRLLAIFHFVLAALSVVGIGFLFLHGFIMHTVFENPEMWKDQKGGPPPEQFFAIFKWFYAIFGVMVVGSGLANLFSGLFIRRNVYRTFSLIVAGSNCLCVPLGTVLGVFTFVVLLRDSVRERYEHPASTGA